MYFRLITAELTMRIFLITICNVIITLDLTELYLCHMLFLTWLQEDVFICFCLYRRVYMVAFAPLLSQEITASRTPGSTVMLIGGPGMAAARYTYTDVF